MGKVLHRPHIQFYALEELYAEQECRNAGMQECRNAGMQECEMQEPHYTRKRKRKKRKN
jgi:hypothetical protein